MLDIEICVTLHCIGIRNYLENFILYMFNFLIYDIIPKGKKKFRGLIACDSEKILLLDVLPMFLGLCDSPAVKYTK